MNKRIMGIILSILGFAGLVVALLLLAGFEGSDHVSVLVICGILAAILFFTGVRLIPDATVVAKEKEAGI